MKKIAEWFLLYEGKDTLEESNWFGNESQLIGIKRYRLLDGREKGVECIDIEGTNGLSFTAVPDRCLDISALRYMGKNICYRSINGVSGPSYYKGTDQSRRENFFYGMLSTCGLENTGQGCTVDGKTYVQHGSLNQFPAEDVRIERYGAKLEPSVRITGTVTQYLFREYHYLVHREIDYYDRTSKIRICDRVENRSCGDVPVCIMYHYNFGYPFLSEALKLTIPSKLEGCKNEDAERGLSTMLQVTPPMGGYRPQVFYHSFEGDGFHTVTLENQELSIGVRLSFHGSTLPKLNYWKMLGEREYVLALEPCNQFPYGRKTLLEKNCHKILRSHETAEYRTELEFYQTGG